MLKRLTAMLGFCGLFLLASHQVAHAEWPERTVTIVVAYSAGGTNDLITRMVAERLSDRFGTEFIVENRTGAAGRVAASYVAQQPADGYTFLNGAPGLLLFNQFLYEDTPYTLDDFDAVSQIVVIPYVLLAAPGLELQSVDDLIDLAKERPGELNHAATGSGPTLVQQLFKETVQIEFENIIYEGTPATIPDLVRGDIDFMFDLIPAWVPHIEDGSVTALAVSGSQRSSALPDLPTLEEAGIEGFQPVNWFGIVAPSGTPQEILDTMSEEIVNMLQDEELRARLAELGADPVGNTPEEFDGFLRSEYDLWSDVVERAGLERQ